MGGDWRSGPFEVGKIPPEVLSGLVFKKTGARRSELVVPSAVGEDTAVLDLGDEMLVTSTDPITGAGERAGWLAVKVALNDLGAAGAEPVAILVTLLLPEGSGIESLELIMGEIHQACTEENVAVAGGHTEVTPGLARPIISVTAIGKTRSRRVLSARGARAGDDLLVTKWAGMEGTSVLVRDFEKAFRAVLTEEEIREAEDLISRVSVVKDGRIAADNGASACHDATEGGVLGAVYEMCEASGLGVELDADVIPVLPVTRKVSEFVGVDPLRLVSSGCLIVAARDGTSLCEAYRKSGLTAQVVGRMTSGGRFVTRGGSRTPLEPPRSDELWRGRAYLEALAAKS